MRVSAHSALLMYRSALFGGGNYFFLEITHNFALSSFERDYATLHSVFQQKNIPKL
jgi:hypothetical protein